jgi:hypothetical protein
MVMKDATKRSLTIHEIRREHNITSRAVADAAGVDFYTEYLLEIGGFVERGQAIKILQALASLTGEQCTIENVAGLCTSIPSPVSERTRRFS